LGFGSGGFAYYNYNTSTDILYDGLVEPDGDLLVAGDTSKTSFAPTRPTLGRFRANGTLVPSFGTGGILRVLDADENVYNGWFGDVVRLPDGRLVAAGGIGDTVGYSYFLIARFYDNICGNGILEFGEDCDDGNHIAGDCCSATCHFDPEGSVCGDDGARCTADTCDGAGTCTHTPNVRPFCRHTTIDARSELRIDDRAGATKDVIAWKLAKGEVVGLGELGNPQTVTGYTLCGFDFSGSPSGAMLFELHAPPAGTCGSKPCWTQASSGFRYRNAAGAADGTFKVKAGAGRQG